MDDNQIVVKNIAPTSAFVEHQTSQNQSFKNTLIVPPLSFICHNFALTKVLSMKILFTLLLVGWLVYRFHRSLLRLGRRFFGWVSEGYRKEGDLDVSNPSPRSRRPPNFGGDYVDYQEVK